MESRIFLDNDGLRQHLSWKKSVEAQGSCIGCFGFIFLIFHCNHVIRKPGVQMHLAGPVCCRSPPDVGGSALRLRPDPWLPPSVPEKQKMLCLPDR